MQEHLPLKIGAMGGPRSMELAGEIADGLQRPAPTPPRRCVRGRYFKAGAERAGRAARRSTSATRCSVRSRPTARSRGAPGRMLAAFYIPSMPPRCSNATDRPEEVAPVIDAFAAGDMKRALALTPDAVVDRLVVAGTPDDWLAGSPRAYTPAG